MYTKKEDVTSLERKYGIPRVEDMHFELHPWEFDLVVSSMSDGRSHDVTMFIRKNNDPSRIAVIRKPFFSPRAFRAPSGAAKPGESLEAGAIRESMEETGLQIDLVRYLLRIKARFTCGKNSIAWTSHVLEARHTGGEPDPEDTDEIAEARWATIDELKGEIREALIDAGWDLFRYRVALTDLTLERMEEGT